MKKRNISLKVFNCMAVILMTLIILAICTSYENARTAAESADREIDATKAEQLSNWQNFVLQSTSAQEVQSTKIKRPYTEIFQYVDALPADFEEHPYSSNLEDIEVVRDDLKKLKDGKVRKVEYYDEESSFIMSWSNDDISFRLTTDETEDTKFDIFVLNKDVSFYSKDGKLLICGREDEKRQMSAYFLHTGDDISIERFDGFDTDNIDLLGVSLDEEDEATSSIDDISNFTLVRKKNNFLFYQYGKLLKKVKFPGAAIQNKVFKDGYILDKNKDLYYLYFNADPENITMKFYKVAEGIDEVVTDCSFMYQDNEQTTVQSWYNGETYHNIPVYKKDGKEYVTFFDPFEEYHWGLQNCGNRFDVPVKSKKDGGETFELSKAELHYAILYIGDVQPNYYVDDYYLFHNGITIKTYKVWHQSFILEEFWDLQGKILSEEERDELVAKLDELSK